MLVVEIVYHSMPQIDGKAVALLLLKMATPTISFNQREKSKLSVRPPSSNNLS
jgi:hypothetical protein